MSQSVFKLSPTFISISQQLNALKLLLTGKFDPAEVVATQVQALDSLLGVHSAGTHGPSGACAAIGVGTPEA